MDKTERLFAIMDALRRHRKPVTAAHLAEEQGVSVRTLYRDIQTLIGLGAPIEGEAGLGYMLRSGFFLPPLMFSVDELEALVLGARWVGRQPDEGLAEAAENALAKIATASPEDLRDRIADTGLWPSITPAASTPQPWLKDLRQAMRRERAVLVGYADETGQRTQREIWPVQLAYYEGKQIIAAWCCLREDFRHFRIDRIEMLTPLDTRFGRRRASLEREWAEGWQAQMRRWRPEPPDNEDPGTA
ncbi:DeoR family transcriptional regulator [Devosia pacifica]|uniref:DeoR family transcriptional regulator n=1 Tax=Devosia pacifica TaxID=1335967 RepID=A0A918VT19_9HYPH|nr:YafY family protein [Devosia pacifica]GHA22454.1 DeoR family transcriptional regulator [Devosia pacifica]